MSDILKIAILAVGGQGGGVLSGWVAALAEANGYVVQVTSVAGVAQRTGATIYYIEMAPKGAQQPVFALSPTPGDIDVLIAAEIMEAGRAAQRGFLSPDRTTLVTSTHRILAVTEKQVPGDGRGDGSAVESELQAFAKAIVAFDMERLALEAGSFISASLFGGLARSGALPFAVDAYRAILEGSAKGAAASLRAFDAAVAYVPNAPDPQAPVPAITGPDAAMAEWQAMTGRISAMCTDARAVLQAGLQKVVDYQDLAYGADYLDRVGAFLGHSETLDRAAAKYIANAMCYDDLPRVADLKTRGSRTDRLRNEQEIPDGSLVRVTEYFHPRAEEVCATLPRRLGAAIVARPWAMRGLGLLFRKGRRVRTDGVIGFTTLWCVAGLRPFRRLLLRHETEMAHLDALTRRAQGCLPERPELAAEILSCQRLIKGYSDTHARGLSRFDQVMEGLDLVLARTDAADWLRRIREAALADTTGDQLAGALDTVRSFTPPAATPPARPATPA
ncbi:indolepyruvate oxidoreductase subunit beta family protein [Rhodophyticola sp. CCM32]|uniref:indolepyruvate oxidoreductase subunit beta family protein n=1 Tax=Rhodophyticola sp. CCM32 TaxID=2916397 RepID=UPI001EE5DEA1|nr:indolepyruvate oxidoreductase subunit beta family protein [Rhodophyticola sp. CCM32]